MPESAGGDLARRLAAYPREAFSFFDSAFSDAALLSEDDRSHVLDQMVNNLKRGSRRLNGSVLQSITGMSERVSDQIASVYSVLIGLLAESEVSPEEFVQKATGVLFAKEREGIALQIARDICASRPGIGSIVDRAQLAGEVFPSFLSLDLAIDLRIRFVEGKMTTTVPVALIHIATDASDKDFFAQFTGSDLEEVIRRMTMCLNDLKKAETFKVSDA